MLCELTWMIYNRFIDAVLEKKHISFLYVCLYIHQHFCFFSYFQFPPHWLIYFRRFSLFYLFFACFFLTSLLSFFLSFFPYSCFFSSFIYLYTFCFLFCSLFCFGFVLWRERRFAIWPEPVAFCCPMKWWSRPPEGGKMMANLSDVIGHK